MDRDQTVQILSRHLHEMQNRFGVASLSLFGSVARGEGKAGSDLDIMVTYTESPGFFGFLDLKDYLEQLLSCPVDLVTNKALKTQLKERILKEAISVH